MSSEPPDSLRDSRRLARAVFARCGGCAPTCGPMSARCVMMAHRRDRASSSALAIPLVTKAIIDGPITDGDAGRSCRSACSRSPSASPRPALILIRRWVQARAVLGFETAIRNDLYRHMQALPMEFHGRWQSGQLLSRVTVDLSAIRRFTGFGMLFLVINILQLTVVTRSCCSTCTGRSASSWPVSAVPDHRPQQAVRGAVRRRVSRRVQDQQGDVATAVEEAAVGFRAIKSFGRSALRRGQVRRPHHDALRHVDREGAAVHRGSGRFLEIIPNVSLGHRPAAGRARGRPGRQSHRAPWSPSSS